MSTKKEGGEQPQTMVDFKLQLETQLQELTRKKQLADRRSIFLSKKENLLSFLEQLNEESNSGNFESVDAKISFVIKSGYRDEEQFSIAIPEMILSHISRLLDDIDKAVLKIEADLLA